MGRVQCLSGGVWYVRRMEDWGWGGDYIVVEVDGECSPIMCLRSELPPVLGDMNGDRW